uniref:Geminin n=1 Tax=Anopheles dirus TaxID=7168 RepID=A0A182N150_9DIPT
MSASSVANIVISEDSASEQEEIKKASRMTLKEVQNVVSTLKENFHPRKPLSQPPGKDLSVATASKIACGKHGAEPTEPKRCKMVEQLAKATQTVSEDEHNLTGCEPTEGYWEKVAEKRRLALQETLEENATLYLKVATLEEELEVAHSVTQSLQSLVETMVEMLNEGEGAGKSDPDASHQVDDSGLAQSFSGEEEAKDN